MGVRVGRREVGRREVGRRGTDGRSEKKSQL